MPASADNFVYSDYVSDDGNTYSIRTLASFQAHAGFALTATSTHPRYGKATRRRAPRHAIYQDAAALGRKLTAPVGTVAAFNTLTASLGTTPDTITRSVRGEATARTYTLIKTVPERVESHTIQSAAPQQP